MATSAKVDLFKQHKEEYVRSRSPRLVQTQPARYLTVRGQGPPGSDAFTERIGALYGMAYTVKMTRKAAGEQDYVVSKLEARWWAEPEGSELTAVPPEDWHWELLIRTPDFVAGSELVRAREALLGKGKGDHVDEVGLETLDEGRCVQMLHVGPYDREAESLGAMAAFAAEQGLVRAGRHHEIYLSDPRRMAADKLKTLLRMPVRPGA